MLVIFFLILVSLIVCLIVGITIKRRSLIILLPAFLISSFLFFKGVNLQFERNKENANRIIKALEQYKIKNGSYPNHLLKLKPKYLKSVPNEWFGIIPKEFTFEIEHEKVYSLTLKMGNKPIEIWYSSMPQWQFFE